MDDMSTLMSNGHCTDVAADDPTPRPRTMLEMAADIQYAASNVDDAKRQVALAQEQLAEAERALADAVDAAAPLRTLFAKPTNQRRTRTPLVKSKPTFRDWCAERMPIGEKFNATEACKTYANEMGIPYESGMSGSVYTAPRFRRISKGVFARIK